MRPIPCKECGAQIQAATPEDTARLMAKHVSQEHGSLEAKLTAALTKCHAVIMAALSSVKLPKSQLRELHGEISDLLKIPRLPAQIEEEKKDASVSHPDVSQNLPATESVVAPESGDALPGGSADQPPV